MASAQILVVEDEYIVATNIRQELASMGYEVAGIASSGEEALQLAEETLPDLILMDIVLKGTMDGVEVSEELRDRYDIPIVYLTAYSDDGTLRRAKITEPYGYLIKPYEERELRTTIETALFRHRMQKVSEGMKRWLAAVFRSISDGLIVINVKGQVTLMNRAAEILTAWSSDEAFGKRFDEVLHVVDAHTRMVIDSPVAKASRERGPIRLPGNALLILRTGAETPIEGTLAPVSDGAGDFTDLVLVFRDGRAVGQQPIQSLDQVERCNTVSNA